MATAAQFAGPKRFWVCYPPYTHPQTHTHSSTRTTSERGSCKAYAHYANITPTGDSGLRTFLCMCAHTHIGHRRRVCWPSAFDCVRACSMSVMPLLLDTLQTK